MSLNKYHIDVSSLSYSEFNEVEKKLNDIAEHVYIVDIPTTTFEVLFRSNDNIDFIKTLFPTSCIFTKID